MRLPYLTGALLGSLIAMMFAVVHWEAETLFGDGVADPILIIAIGVVSGAYIKNVEQHLAFVVELMDRHMDSLIEAEDFIDEEREDYER
jgi:hypothetical protein